MTEDKQFGLTINLIEGVPDAPREPDGGEAKSHSVMECYKADARIRELEAESERRRILLEKSDARVTRLSGRVEELEGQLAAKEATIADLRDLAYNRAPKMAADELQRQKEEYEARLAELESRAASSVAALRAVEWVPGGDGSIWCAWCASALEPAQREGGEN